MVEQVSVADVVANVIEVDEEVVLEAEGVVHAGIAFQLCGDVFVGEGVR